MCTPSTSNPRCSEWNWQNVCLRVDFMHVRSIPPHTSKIPREFAMILVALCPTGFGDRVHIYFVERWFANFNCLLKSTLRASLCGSPSGVHRPCPRHHTCTVRCSIHTPYQECAISSNRCVTAKQGKVRNWHPSWREMLCKESGWRSCYSRD